MPELDLTALATERARLRTTYLRTGAARTPTTARGVHHVALLCTNVERTIQFYQDLLEFCLLYTSPSPRDRQKSRMPSSA